MPEPACVAQRARAAAAPASKAVLLPPSHPPPGGRATAGFFAAVDSIRAFLRDEAVADGWSDGDATSAGDGGDGGGAAARALVRPGAPAGTARPPPDWDWVAGQLLPLLQQYSAGLSEPVMRTAIWQAWRMLPGGGRADAAASARWTPWPAATTPGADAPATLELAVLGGRPARAASGLPAELDVVPAVGGAAPLQSAPHQSPRPAAALLHSSMTAWVGDTGLAEPGEEEEERATTTSPLVRGCVVRLAGVRAWRPVVVGGGTAAAAAAAGPGSAPPPRPPVRLLPTPALALVAPDRAAALASARRLALGGSRRAHAAKVVPPSAAAVAGGAAGRARTQPLGGGGGALAPPPAVIVDAAVVGVSPVPEPPGSAAASRARTGAARIVWLADGGGGGGGSHAPTPLLCLDGWAPGAALFAPGDRVVLLDPGTVPPGGGAPAALELRDGGGGGGGGGRPPVVWLVPAAGGAEDGGEEGGGGGGGAGDQNSAPGRPAGPRPGTEARAPLAALTPGTRRVALAGVAAAVEWVGAGRGGGGHCVRLTLAEGRGEPAAPLITVCVPVPRGAAPCPAARAAMAARPGDAVVVTCAAARLVRARVAADGTDAATTLAPSLPTTQAGGRRGLEAWPGPGAAFTVQALPRLPALLASPALWGPAEQALTAAAQPAGPSSAPGLLVLAGGPALVRAAVGAGPAFAIVRTHVTCGRPLRRADLWGDDDDDNDDGKGGGGGGGGAAAPSPHAIPLSLAAEAPPAPPGASPAGEGSAAGGGGRSGDLWSCAFCGVDCAGADVGLTLAAAVRLVPVRGGGDPPSSSPPSFLPVRAAGPPAAALAGGVAAEYLAWSPARRAAAAAALVGRTVRAVVQPARDEGGQATADAAAVLVLGD